jgi:hypothetical protein
MDSSIHSILIAQHVQARMEDARAARQVRELRRGAPRAPKLRLRLRRRSVMIPQI